MKRFDAHDVRVIVIGQKLKEVCTETEKWYNTKYKVEKIDDEVINVSFSKFCVR